MTHFPFAEFTGSPYELGRQHGETFRVQIRRQVAEMHDVAAEPTYSDVKARMLALLLDNLYGTDLKWIENGNLVGLPDMERTAVYDHNPTFGNARGYRIR